ncbi:MAG: HEAT repeat domain-containing protein [Planctomycetota bacterium]
MPNPFATPLKPRRQSGAALFAAIRVAVIAGIVLLAVIGISQFSRSWLLNRLTKDFDSLSPPQRIVRLGQLAEFGEASVQVVARSLTDPDAGVARTAYELLETFQTDWAALPRSTRLENQATLVQALRDQSAQLPDERTGYAVALLRTTLADVSADADESSQKLHRQASEAMAQLTLSDRPGQSVLENESPGTRVPQRVAARTQPLAVPNEDLDRWTQWPSIQTPQQINAADAPETTTRESLRDLPNPPSAGSSEIASPSAQVLQSGPGPLPVDGRVGLTPVTTAAPRLKALPGSATVAARPSLSATGPLIRPTSLTSAPLTAYTDGSVIRLLGSRQLEQRQAARDELARRGLSENEIQMANRVGQGNVVSRLALIDELASNAGANPLPWLMILLEDPHRNVRMKVISVLMTWQDVEVKQRLRMHLAKESDPFVVQRLKRHLEG